MSRISELRKGSFRGVVFQVRGIEDAYGRRIVTHTFPGYDTPYTEDNGKRPGVWSVDAFVAGDDYITQANELISACQQAGSGYFVHSWLGGKQVICQECTPSWNFQGLGECNFRLRFQEEGEPLYPSANTDYIEITKTRAASALESFLLQFAEVYSLSGPEWLSAEMAAIFTEAMEMISEGAEVAGLGSDILAELIDDIQDAIDTADDIIDDGEAVADAVDDALSGVAEVIDDDAEAVSALTSIATSTSSLEIPEPTTAGTTTLSEAAETFAELVSRLAVTHGISTAMDADYGSRKEALAARDELVEAIDSLVDSASERGEHDSFEALRQLRADVVNAFRDKAGSLPGVLEIRLSSPAPALVLAYNLYQDLDRENELLERNPSVRHPGLMPGGEALEVLDA